MPAAAAVRTRLTNLDSVQQALLWRKHGPAEALDRTVAMIRSTLMLSDQIIVDRNQLLDGVCLLALGPDGLRWHLGLAPHSPLPITVTCSGRPGSGIIDVDEQLAAVSRNRFASSASAALLTQRDPSNPLDWLLSEPARASADPTGRVPHGLLPPGPGLADEPAEAVLGRMREQWAAEMRRGGVTLAQWKPTSIVAHLRASAQLVTGDHPLVAELLAATEQEARRSEILELLRRNLDRFGVDECRAAFLWWSNAYYDAICAANAEYRISFGDASATDDVDGRVRDNLRVEWGLSAPAPTALRRIAQRLSFRRLGPNELVPLEGEIVENMKRISPAGFRSLVLSEPLRAGAFWEQPTNRRMYNLALAVRRTASMNSEQRSRVLVQRSVQFALVLTAAVLLGLRDVGVLPAHGAGWIWYWAGLAFLAAFPWDLVKELFSLSPVSMTGTIRIGEQPRRTPIAASALEDPRETVEAAR